MLEFFEQGEFFKTLLGSGLSAGALLLIVWWMFKQQNKQINSILSESAKERDETRDDYTSLMKNHLHEMAEGINNLALAVRDQTKVIIDKLNGEK